MTLPYDFARCPGTTAPVCANCRRREPGRPDGPQVFIEPAVDVYGTCSNAIMPHVRWTDRTQERDQ